MASIIPMCIFFSPICWLAQKCLQVKLNFIQKEIISAFKFLSTCFGETTIHKIIKYKLALIYHHRNRNFKKATISVSDPIYTGTFAFTHRMRFQKSLPFTLDMCISITEADAMRISIRCQRYDTLTIHLKHQAMRYDTIHPCCDTVQYDLIQHYAIRGDTMRFKIMILQYGTTEDFLFYYLYAANHKLTKKCFTYLVLSKGLFC